MLLLRSLHAVTLSCVLVLFGTLHSFALAEQIYSQNSYVQPSQNFDLPSSLNNSFGSSPQDANNFLANPSNSLPPITPLDSTPKGPRRPPVGLNAEWLIGSNDGLVTSEANITLPILGVGSPPPLIKVGFTFTDLIAGENLDLPDSLFEYTIGVSWIKPINDRWVIRTMLGIGHATDNENRTSDAWQFRGGMFAIFKYNEQWSWTFGALATGRQDLPVIPAVGAVWNQSDILRVDFTFPKPKINWLLIDTGTREHWSYVGAGFGGRTWAYQKSDGTNDLLTYSDWRFVLGWESRPSGSGRMPYAAGQVFNVELGYVFSRDLEFDRETTETPLDDVIMLSISSKF